MAETSDSRECLVCTAPIASTTHLGMEACRACASFFKRTKTAGKQYPCRTGQRSCTSLREGKFTCRRCRFDKCIAIGMEYEGPLRERRKSTMSIIQKVKNEWRAYLERRRECELQLIKSHGGHKRVPHPTEELYDVHQDTVYDIFLIAIPAATTFLRNTFPALCELLSEKEQELIAKDYMGKMSLVEGYYRTKQIWSEVNRYVMCSVATCHDYERKWEGIEEIENARFMLSFAENFNREQNAVYLPMFNRSSLTEFEFFALMAIVLGEVGTNLDSSFDLSEEALVILDKYRREVLEDLEVYYRNELGLKNFAVRLGNLMSINHTAQECKSLFNVFFRFYATIFDVFITNEKIKELIL